MKIKIQQFLWGGTLYSWSQVGIGIGRALIKRGHEVHFVSTDGIKDKYLPKDLIPFTKDSPQGEYFCQVSYTSIHKFPENLSSGKKNRFGIWNFDGAPTAPPDEIKFLRYCDKLCPSSNFSRDVFLNSKVPKDKLVVIPHGMNLDEFKNKEVYPLNTEKKYKILYNISTPHVRKNLPNTLETFGRAFTKDDDVCLVIKVSNPKCSDRDKLPKQPNKPLKKGQVSINLHSGATIDFDEILKTFKKKYPNHAEIKIINGFVPSLVELYNACDIIFMMSHMEMFWLPGLEAFAAGKMVIASNYSGQLHYLNKDNSLLINGKVVRMPKNYQYWGFNPYAEMFEPNIEDGVAKLKLAINNYDSLMEKFRPNIELVSKQLTWDNVAKQIEDMCE